MRKNIHPHIDTKMVMGGRSIWGLRCRWLTFHCHVCMHDEGLKEVGKCCLLCCTMVHVFLLCVAWHLNTG